MIQSASPEQKGVIYYNEGEGALLVNASAGSGKTFVLTERVRYLLTSKEGKFKILCLTFTNKAAEEMKSRLSELPDISERAFIGTLHSFALDILTSRRNEIGYEEVPHILERESDRIQILKEIFFENIAFRDFISNKDSKEINDLLYRALNLISEGKKQLKFPDDNSLVDKWDHNAIELYEKYNESLKSQNLIDYDDILLLAWKILINNPSVSNLYRKIFKYILVDEAQDLSYAQYELIRAICGDELKNVFMVGDPNQAIHGYAGASKKYMEQHFVNDFGAKVINLIYNYRSSEAILKIAERITQTGSNTQVQAYFTGYSEVRSFENEDDEATWILSNVKKILNKKEIQGEIVNIEDIAVLARNKYVFNTLISKLEEDPLLKNNYYIKKGSDSLLPESVLMTKFDLGTRLLSNPKDLIHYRQLMQAIKKEGINVTPSSVLSQAGIKTLTNLFSAIPSKCADTLIKAWKILDDNINNFSTALNALKDYAKENESENLELISLDIASWSDTWEKYIRNSSKQNRSVSDFRRFAAMGGSSIKNNNGLVLSVVHMVKGLEFHTVFLMGMNEGTFPDYRAVKKGGAALSEEHNTAYVAVTRAKRQIFISYPQNKMMPWGDKRFQQPSRFIENILNR